ncbi:MAG: cupredoxin domain-containing protein [Candidatus Bipolaricaulota bacterium]|nr:cupredoxin domain-containing protein [Candidatus Bipolaricaulota bacterium]
MPKYLAGVMALTVLVLSGCDLFRGQQPSEPTVQEISIVLKEWQIIPARVTIKAGKVRFVVKNQGTVDHGFEVEGADLEEEIDPFPPGRTRTLELDLAPGTYEIYCQVPGHEELGMKGELIVKP